MRAPYGCSRSDELTCGGSGKLRLVAQNMPSIAPGQQSLRAGRRAPALMRMIHSAKLNALDPYAYLRDVLERRPSQADRTIAELLPHRWGWPQASPWPRFAATAPYRASTKMVDRSQSIFRSSSQLDAPAGAGRSSRPSRWKKPRRLAAARACNSQSPGLRSATATDLSCSPLAGSLERTAKATRSHASTSLTRYVLNCSSTLFIWQ